MRRVVLGFTAILPVLVHANDIQVGMPFKEARKLLFEKKWRPVDVHAGTDYSYIGIEHQLIKNHFNELESCAVDRPICIFNYKRKNQCLRVFTSGEKMRAMSVVEWKNECPE